MPITLGQFTDCIIPKAIERITLEQDAYDKKAQYKQFIKTSSDDALYHESKAMEGMGPLVDTPERSRLSELALGDGYSKRIFQHKYAGKASYPFEVKHFDRIDIIAQHTKALADAAPFLKEVICAALLESGHLAAASVTQINGRPIVDTVSADGQPIFSASHTFKSNPGATWSNYFTGAPSLTRTNWATHSNTIMRMQGSNGRYLNIMPENLIIPTALRQAAYELTHSTLQPDTALNAVNSVKQDLKAGSYTVYTWLTSAVNWYIRTSYPNRFIMRHALKPKTANWYDEDTQAHFISLTEIFSLGVDDPRHMVKIAA